MQKSIATAVALLGRRGLLAGSGASLFGGAFTGSHSLRLRLTDQCSNFSTHPSPATHKPERTEKSSVQSTPPPVPAATATTARQWPYMIKRKAAAAVRIKARAIIKAAKDKALLTARSAALKARQSTREVAARVRAERTKSNATAKAKQLVLDKNSAERKAAEKIKSRIVASKAAAKRRACISLGKLQARKSRNQERAVADKEKARAKMQMAKDMATQRAALIIKRAPSGYALYVKERFMALGHVPVGQRFQTIGAEYKQLKPDMRETYEVSAAKLKAEVYAKRAVIAATRVQRPINGYMVFFTVKYKQVKTADPASRPVDIARVIGKQWLALSDSEKQGFKAQAASLAATAV